VAIELFQGVMRQHLRALVLSASRNKQIEHFHWFN